MKKKFTLGTSVSKELHDNVIQNAEKLDRSKGYIVRKVMEYYYSNEKELKDKVFNNN